MSGDYILTVGAGNEVIQVDTIAWSPDGKQLAAHYFGLSSKRTNDVKDTV
jgi:hypothetical protein